MCLCVRCGGAAPVHRPIEQDVGGCSASVSFLSIRQTHQPTHRAFLGLVLFESKLQTVWNMQRRRGALRALMPLCTYEGMKRLSAQPFNPFMPTQELICSMKEQEQQQPPPFGKSLHC